MIKKAVKTGGNIYARLDKDGVFSFSEQLTYRLLASFFPFMLFLVAALSFLEVDKDTLITSMARNLPEQLYGFLRVFVEEIANKRNVGALTIGLAFAAFAASSGFNAFIQGVNRIYGESQQRGFIKTLLLSLLLLLIFTLSIAIMFSSVVFIDSIFKLIFDRLPSAAIRTLTDITSFFLLVLTLSFMYMLASQRKIRLRSAIPGSAAVVLFWAALTFGFNIYYKHFSKDPEIYGSLAGVILLIGWLHMVSLSLLIGGELNSLTAKIAAKMIERRRNMV